MKNLSLVILLFFTISTVKSQMEMWGMSSLGGAQNAGAIFKTDATGGNLSIEHTFNSFVGKYSESTPLEASNGKMYVMTKDGGNNNYGVLFEYDPTTHIYTKKIDFSSSIGRGPVGSLIQATNGKLYGLTRYGGSNYYGTLFEYDISNNSITVLHNFTGTATGANPRGSLLHETYNNKLYGVTSRGGTNDKGVLFEYDIALDTLIRNLSFDGNNGDTPIGGLCKISNGIYYGMTLLGGSSNKGILFAYSILTPAHIFVKHSFSGVTGEKPQGELILIGNDLYGMTRYGGANNDGLLFTFNKDTDVFSSLIDFSSSTTGKEPFGSLLKATNGHLYGLTEQGGANNDGVLFKYVIATNTLTVKKNFNASTSGDAPRGSLIQASNGNLFGLTAYGGMNNLGVFFEYKISTNSFMEQYDFYSSNEGKRPFGTLVKVNDDLFGVTAYGGLHETGVIFKYNLVSSSYTKLIDFDGASKGSSPYGNLTLANNGKLYGMTRYGGVNDEGVIFEFDPVSYSFTKKIDFDNVASGRYPRSGLVLASNGLMYGVTRDGGVSDIGVLFSYNPNTNTFVKIRDFNGSYKGKYPYGNLIEASNGKLYGLAREGGVNDDGVLFEYDIVSDIFTRKVSFSNVSKGRKPYGDLVETSNGELYGMTGFGGTNDVGVIFEYNINTDTYTKKLNLNNSHNPFSSMIKASNGKLYGMIRKGGANDDGVLFQYNTSTNTFTSKHDFDKALASVPYYSNLLEISSCYTSFATINPVEWCSYTSPSGTYNWTSSGTYADTVANVCGGDSILTINLTLTIENATINQIGNQLIASENGAVYQWLDCGNNYAILPGETNQSYSLLTNGSYAVSVTKNGCTDTSACFSSNALHFDGYNDRVVCPNTSSNNLIGGTPGFTIETWIYPTSWENDAQDGVIIQDYDEIDEWYGHYKHGYSLAVGDAGKVYFKIGYNNSIRVNETNVNTLALNKWQHLAVTYSGSYMRIYVDGVLIKSYYCPDYTSSSNSTYIGYVSDGKGFHGKIDDMRLWKKTKTASEINNEMHQELCEFPSELKAYYTFNQGVSGGNNSGVNTLLDHSTYGNDGVLSGFYLSGNYSNWLNGFDLIGDTIDLITCRPSKTSFSGNQIWTTSGMYADTLFNSNTCDSIVSVNLTINGTTASRTDTVCDLFTNPNSQNYYTSGVYTYTLTNAAGCDSVVTLNLTVKQSTDTTISVEACDSFVSASGIIWDTSGTYNDTIPNVVGCDSVITYQLNIFTSTLSITQDSTIYCYGDSSATISVNVNNTGPSEVFFQGFENYTGSTNIYYDGALSGLDSCYYSNTLNTWGRLRIPGLPSFVRTGNKSMTLDKHGGSNSLYATNYFRQTIDLSTYTSDSLTFSFWFVNHGGTNHTEDRLWIRGNSSDSWLEVFDWESNSTVGQWTYHELDITSLLAGAGQSVSASFQYRFGQRDNQKALGLTYYTGLSVDDISIRAKYRGISYLWSNGDTTSTIVNVPAGQYLVTVNSAVCSISDSITIIQPYQMHFYQALTSCDSLNLHGNLYITSQTVTDTLIASNGCDSIVTSVLSINHSNQTIDYQTACDSLTWIDGITYYTNNNTAIFTLTNVAGCDSTVTLNLIIQQSNTGVDVVTACDSLTWIDGITYYSDNNTATYALTNSSGCDSIVTLDLIINTSSIGDTTAITCDSFNWYGTTYTQSGFPTHNLVNILGCDSVVTLNLTILESTYSTDQISACDSYTWTDGNTYTSSTNTPQYILTNAAGCDSIITLDLTITTIDNSVSVTDPTIVANATGVTYQWLDCENMFSPIVGANLQSFTANSNGEYAVEITENACVDTSECVLISTVYKQDNLLDNQITVYPNPTKGLINIDLGSLKDVSVYLYDLNGKLMQFNNHVEQPLIQLNVPYDDGVYILEIHSEDGINIFRIVLN